MKKNYSILFFTIAASVKAYLFIKKNIYSFTSSCIDNKSTMMDEKSALLKKIEGEWYCMEDCQLYMITVEGGKSIVIRNLTEGSRDECKVASFSVASKSLDLLTKYEGHWHIQILELDKIVMQFGTKEELGDAANPLICRRN